MQHVKRIIYLWLGAVVVFASSLLLPHRELTTAGFVSYCIQLLLFILSIHMAAYEPARKNKFIFVNFAMFFSLSVCSHLYSFVGTLLFPDQQFARFYVSQYVLIGAYFFFLTFAIVYLSLDVLFREFRTIQKYLIALLIVGGFFSYYFHPYLTDPRHSYKTSDVLDWKMLDKSFSKYQEEFKTDPSVAALAEYTQMYSWKDGQATGILFPSEKLRRVEELYPYLQDPNYLILVYKPLYMITINMCIVSIGFILLFFGYLYMKDPPQGAYIEKVMFLFLVFCSLEILHAWSFIKSVEWSSFSGVWTVGEYVSIAVLVSVALTFFVRLRFITSVKGEFYEQELAASPTAVTRWRDTLDNIVIEKFFNRKLILGRLFVAPGSGDKAQ